MREQLIKYVDLLFAGAPEHEDVKQEILQNTLDRYEDLIAQGKNPRAAYSLAIAGIGDLSEILQNPDPLFHPLHTTPTEDPQEKKHQKLLRSISTALYILCPVPLFLIGDEVGLCLLLLCVAVATMLSRIAGPSEEKRPTGESVSLTPQQELRKSIRSVGWAIGTALFFILSFLTDAWHITWLLFPLTGATLGLIIAILDLKEANRYET